ncbi:hypothetical protein [Caulobacter soli]|uniref:hypothetical protein n=1 Tax=Caulobacter soli TaxID=2708539 RepID=UPI0013E9B15E|nr:hypothetical protein [Caulobacter soli]
MKSNITRLQWTFFGIFLAACVGVFAYHYLWVWPKARCDARGGAWAGKWMKCGTIYPIETLTHRPLNVPPINTDPKKMEGPSASKPAK